MSRENLEPPNSILIWIFFKVIFFFKIYIKQF
jgi:hypothetical protein